MMKNKEWDEYFSRRKVKITIGENDPNDIIFYSQILLIIFISSQAEDLKWYAPTNFVTLMNVNKSFNFQTT